MRQSDSVSEELDTENVQCALDFENTMNELETQLYYRHLPPKEVALRVMEAACKFYDADWCGLIQVDWIWGCGSRSGGTMNAKKIKPLSLQMSLNRLNFSTAG